MPNEPCLCGDPLCPKCFDFGGMSAGNRYAIAMQTTHVKLIRNYCDSLLDAIRTNAEEGQIVSLATSLNAAIESWRGDPDKAIDGAKTIKAYRKALTQIANASAGDCRRGEDEKGYWHRFASELRQLAKDALYHE